MSSALERRFRSKKFETEHNLRRKQTEWYSFAVANNMIEFGAQNKAEKEKKINENFSHTLLAGGVLNVPIERQMELLLALSKDIANNYVPDFNEVSPPITRFYMDLDFKDKLEEGGLQLFYPRTITEMNNGNGTENFPAIVVEEQGLERKRYDNILVADCIAAKVVEYFPSVDPSSNFFHVHCMWRPSRFKYRENHFINANGKHVRETVVAERSFGFHLVWPNLHVTHAQALDIREGVIRALASKFFGKNSPNNRSRPGTNPWQEVVDVNIYLPLQTLRMVLSDKYETCKDCVSRNLRVHGTKMAPKKRKIDDSETKSTDLVALDDPLGDYRMHCPCHGSGKIPANSIYKYEATVSGDHKELTEAFRREFQRDVFQMLVQCSIRDPHRPDLVRNNCFAANDPIMVLPNDAPRYKGFKPSSKESLSSNEKNHENYKNKTQVPASSTKTYAGTKEDEELSLDSREFFAVQNLFINAASVTEQAKRAAGNNTQVLNFSVYEKVVVHRLRRCCLNGNYFYLVDVTDSGDRNDANFCFNINRVHTCVKNVFFKITPKSGIVQRCNCFSKNRQISCQNYQSPPCALPKDCADILFPTELLQKAVDANKASIVATTLRRSKSVLELSRDKIESEIEKPFVAIALEKSDAEAMRQFAVQNQIVGSDDGLMSSSQSPSDVVQDQKYQLLCKKNDIIELSSIEKEALMETKTPKLAHHVEAIVEKCKCAETKSATTRENSVATKLLDAFQDTFSVAYHNET